MTLTDTGPLVALLDAVRTKQDLGRVPMKMGKPASMIEKYQMTLASTGGNKGSLTLEWENTSASVDFTVK